MHFLSLRFSAIGVMARRADVLRLRQRRTGDVIVIANGYKQIIRALMRGI